MLSSYFSGSPAATMTVANQMVDRVRPALATIKAALDERDNWELLAAEHERKSFPATPAVNSGGSRGKGSGGGKTARSNKSDLSARPSSNFKVPNRVPRNIRNRIVWFTAKIDLSDITGSTSIAETNYGFAFNQVQNYATWAALFDQYCIVQVSITWESCVPPGSTGTLGVLHTALDFDNTTNVGSLAIIDSYETSQTDVMVPGKMVTRSCRPCLKGDSNAVTSVTVLRSWLDMAQTGLNHFGIRSILGICTNNTVLRVILTYWVALRNTF